MTNIPANQPDPGVSGQQTSTFPANWSPPPFYQKPAFKMGASAWSHTLPVPVYRFA